MSGGFEFSVFGLRIAVLTDCGTAQDFLDRHLLPWLPRGAREPAAADLIFRISRNAEGRFDVSADGCPIASNEGLAGIFGMLQRLIDERAVRRQPDMAVIHAGVVAWNGCAMLLPGASHAGKTTLVMELLKRGAAYYSDEYAFLDGEGRVHPYPRALMPRGDDGWQHPTLPSEWNAATADSPAPVRLILFVEWVRGGRWEVRRIPQSEALLTLLKNTPEEMAGAPDILRRLGRGIGLASCYAGVRGEAGEAAGCAMELLAGLG
jgi:hypothetical protein